jgi:hypothetical protein
MVDNCLFGIDLVTLDWSAAAEHTLKAAYFLDDPCNNATPQCVSITSEAEVMGIWVFLAYVFKLYECHYTHTDPTSRS